MPNTVTVRREKITLPTWLPAAPERHPMFLEKRVYQGSSGRVYPLPFIDRIAESPVPHEWDAIELENEFLQILILPEIGGRVHRMVDKTNGYDVIYHQPVIKPALVGLAGPWISGGIEFNWPQHHRPSTFMPAFAEIEHASDGSVTVWLSEHDPMQRMKGMHGVCLRPGRARLELRVRVFNRTPDVQTFLWWANAAIEVHERYQSFFPPDATFVADHAKRAMSAFPRCRGSYYGVDYAARAEEGVPPCERPRFFVPTGDYPPDDLSWFANIPVPTSYMCMGSREDFFGGYDHAMRAGIVHVADHRIAPGKKQWTWGNQEFGYAWDRNLTVPDARGVYRPYIELMAGVYTDNQPDFSYLQPGETKIWTQYWYPIRAIGPAGHANSEAAVSLRVRGKSARIGASVTAAFPGARIVLSGRKDRRLIFECEADISPEAPFVREVRLPRAIPASDLALEVMDRESRVIILHAPEKPAAAPPPEKLAELAASEPPPPESIVSSDELYFTGVHLEQYRHATRHPEPYWREALRRDPGDARCNLALGLLHLRRGEFADAEKFLRAAIARQTFRNPNPGDGEAYYQLGRVLRFLGREDEAGAAFAKAAWNQAWIGSASLARAELACSRAEWDAAWELLENALRVDGDNLRVRALRVVVLRKSGRVAAAAQELAAARTLDPLDAWTRLLDGAEWVGDTQTRLDLAFDFERAGLLAEAVTLLDEATPEPLSGTAPMVAYTRAWLLEKLGRRDEARAARRIALRASPDCCFPARLEEIIVLESAIAANERDARALFYLGLLLYDRRRHREAVARWERAAALEPGNAVAWRCLGIACFNILKNPKRARAAYEKAFTAAPNDARLLFERDQLWKRLGVSPEKRLRELSMRGDLIAQRDDLTLEFCALLNHCNHPEKARNVLSSRQFQPWEGGEGIALGQHTRAHLRLGRAALERGDHAEALRLFETALAAPENLGEARHLLGNQSDILFWLGEARASAGDRAGARKAWSAAASFRGDFQDMSVRAFSELTYYSAMSMRRMGKRVGAERLLRELLNHATNLERQPARIDYFATSLPTMLLFDDDPQARQTTAAWFLQAQALLGLGRKKSARALLNRVLRSDPTHAMASDLLTAEGG